MNVRSGAFLSDAGDRILTCIKRRERVSDTNISDLNSLLIHPLCRNVIEEASRVVRRRGGEAEYEFAIIDFLREAAEMKVFEGRVVRSNAKRRCYAETSVSVATSVPSHFSRASYVRQMMT